MSATHQIKISRFSLVAKLMGISFLLFFAGAALFIFLNIPATLLQFEWGKFLVRLVRWGELHGGGEHYELMISVIYIVWGWFILKAAKDPLKNYLFFEFTLFANIAHFGAMLVMGLVMTHETPHLIGDVLLGWVILLIYIYFWLPVKKIYKSDINLV
ncbi:MULTISPECIES: DUF6632 domain-containing protein [Acinetobacter]|jgi:hypothetical protein|uniref:DUF6632 domain-containing protein n=1 Tax=Acinetobacter TaxID=469 RepID=UPI0021CDB8E0|nr:DUF6632 domain-containing protein [Acinetobacter sp. WU_MDCI_Abxb74]MCU4424618.1 hypothetical protein [Acinetobacter sp. WU_MDCI_Abxb74]CAI3131261.1 hypothetical protein MWMV7_MWMV7_03545 [Acinetobacter calcoaceticus]